MSADFANFGATALGIAGTTAIVGEEMKMLKGVSDNHGYRCEHCGEMHKTRMSLMRHHKMLHQQKHSKHHEASPIKTGHTSKGNDYEFDFRI